MIPASEQARLEEWFNGPVRQWRMRAYTGKSRRTADGEVRGDLLPPRHLLRSS